MSDAINDPSLANITVAAVGLVPDVGPLASKVVRGAADGVRAGQPFTRAGKVEVKALNAAEQDGKFVCMGCGGDTVPAKQSQRGITPPGEQVNVDHIIPRSKNGNGSPDNGQVLCRDCNLRKGARLDE